MRVAHLRRHVPAPATPADVDVVLLSHLHRDHADGASLRALGTGTQVVIAPAGTAPALRRLGIRPTHELAAGEAVALSPQVTVRAVAAHHDGRRHPLGRPIAALGYLIEGPQRIYFAGDTDLFAGMAQLADPPLDVALLPIWGWGPKLGAGHLDPERAAQAAALLAPRTVVPIHWGTFLPIGTRQHWALVDPIDEFLDRMRGSRVRVAAMAPGGVLDLGSGTTRHG